MGHFFLKNWYLYGSTFKFCGGTSLPKPNLGTPPGATNTIACAQLSKNAWGTKMQINGLKGSQLAKMKKSIPDMSLPWNL